MLRSLKTKEKSYQFLWKTGIRNSTFKKLRIALLPPERMLSYDIERVLSPTAPVGADEWSEHICPFLRHVCVRELGLHGVKAPFSDTNFMLDDSLHDVFESFLLQLRVELTGRGYGADSVGSTLTPKRALATINPSVAAFLDSDLRTLTDYCLLVVKTCYL